MSLRTSLHHAHRNFVIVDESYAFSNILFDFYIEEHIMALCFYFGFIDFGDTVVMATVLTNANDLTWKQTCLYQWLFQ